MYKQLLSVNDFRQSLASYRENNTHKYTGKSTVSRKKLSKQFLRNNLMYGRKQISFSLPLPLAIPLLSFNAYGAQYKFSTNGGYAAFS